MGCVVGRINVNKEFEEKFLTLAYGFKFYDHALYVFQCKKDEYNDDRTAICIYPTHTYVRNKLIKQKRFFCPLEEMHIKRTSQKRFFNGAINIFDNKLYISYPYGEKLLVTDLNNTNINLDFQVDNMDIYFKNMIMYNDKIYITDRLLQLHVFDKDGKTLDIIKYEYELFEIIDDLIYAHSSSFIYVHRIDGTFVRKFLICHNVNAIKIINGKIYICAIQENVNHKLEIYIYTIYGDLKHQLYLGQYNRHGIQNFYILHDHIYIISNNDVHIYNFFGTLVTKFFDYHFYNGVALGIDGNTAYAIHDMGQNGSESMVIKKYLVCSDLFD
jgi:hypothetical protein